MSTTACVTVYGHDGRPTGPATPPPSQRVLCAAPLGGIPAGFSAACTARAGVRGGLVANCRRVGGLGTARVCPVWWSPTLRLGIIVSRCCGQAVLPLPPHPPRVQARPVTSSDGQRRVRCSRAAASGCPGPSPPISWGCAQRPGGQSGRGKAAPPGCRREHRLTLRVVGSGPPAADTVCMLVVQSRRSGRGSAARG